MQSLHELYTSITIIIIGLLGYYSSQGIPQTPAGDSNLKINWNPITETLRNVKLIWPQQNIWVAIVAISWFWFYGATLLAQFPSFAKSVLHGDESVFILLLSFFSIGIGIGSLLCEKLSKGKVELGLVVFGAVGLSLFCIDLYASSTNIHEANSSFILDYKNFLNSMNHWRLLADIAFIGLFGGFYIVPLYVLIQTRADKHYQSRIIAANNIMNAFFMVASAGFSVLIFKLGHTIPQLFLFTAFLNALVIVYLCIRQPEFFNQFLVWIKQTSLDNKRN
jgi:hypothetical protein